ncbi:MAG: PDZ domain-containing protein, partial [Planctomycetota bacterium]
MSLPSPKVSRSGLDAVRFAAAVVAVLGLATQAAAAPPIAFGVEAAATSAADDLAEGHRLERARDWSAAIEHYDAALERHPDDSKLSYGLRRSKIHFGIDRRYADGSFDRDMLGMSPRTAYALFDDIFRQVRDRYVEDVRATAFVAHGTESLYLALANEKFVRGNLAHVDYARVQRLRDRLRARYWNRPVGTASARETVREVARLARSTAGLSETAVVMEYIFGGCNALDDYSNYLTPDRLDDLHGNIAGEFVGLGIEMKAENGQGMFLVDVLPGSPAEEGGLHAGEHIVTIDGVDCRSLSTDDAARLLRGPSGSTVTLRVADGTTERTWQGRFVRR